MKKELYEIELKEAYLKTFANEKTRQSIRYFFIVAANTEVILKRDLSTFTLDEIISVINDSSPLSFNAVRTKFTYAKNYIDWTIRNGYRSSNISPLLSLSQQEYFRYIYSGRDIETEDSIQEIEDHLINIQDKLAIRLPFEGVVGTKYSELLNLKIQDVSAEAKTLLLKDDLKGERKLKVSSRCIDMILSSREENKYYMKNGEAQGKRTKVGLVDNDYIFRSSLTSTIRFGRADDYLIRRKYVEFKKLFNSHHMNVTTISNSGKLKLAKDLYIKTKQLSKLEYDIIAETFGARKKLVNGYLTYNHTPMKKFINVSEIKKIYAEELLGTEIN